MRQPRGNVSALIAEFASRESQFAAAEAFFEKYGVPPLTDEALTRVKGEWHGAPLPKAKRKRAT